MSLLFGGLLVVFLASPAAAAGAEDTDLIVQLEVDLPAQEVELVDPSAFPVRVEPGETVGLTIRVFDSEDPTTPVAVEDSSELVEIRDTTGANTPLRFADMSEGPPGVYATTHTLSEEGEFLIVVQPGAEDRTTLHPESTDQVRLIVGGEVPPPPPDAGSSSVGIVVPVLLVFLVVVLVLLATRKRPGRRYEKKAPGRAEADKDTWWWSG